MSEGVDNIKVLNKREGNRNKRGGGVEYMLWDPSLMPR